MTNKKHLLNRTDLSDCIVHLTRDTTESNTTAKENLVTILNLMKIEARNHHCLFKNELLKEDKEIQDKFNVVCFTETPILKLKELFEIENRQKHLEPYGIVFFKDTQNHGGTSIPTNMIEHPNPVLYLNKLNTTMISVLMTQYRNWINQYKEIKIDSNFYLLGSLINYVGDKHDFTWEREWRVVGDYTFILPDIVAIIAPEEEHSYIRKNIDHFSESLTIIDANWTIEDVIIKVGAFAWKNRYQHEKTLSELDDLKALNNIEK